MTLIVRTKPRNWLRMECTQKDEIENCDRLPNEVELPSPEVN